MHATMHARFTPVTEPAPAPTSVLARSAGSRFAIAARYGLYTALLAALFPLLLRVAATEDAYVFRENGPMEWAQAAMLAAAAVLFCFAARRQPERRTLLLFLAAGMSVAVLRELDAVWHGWIHAVPRKAPAVAGGVVLLALAWRARRRLLPQMATFLRSRGFAILWAGTVIAGLLAQLGGQGAFLEALTGVEFDRSFKRVTEETGEVFGYAVVMLGALETALARRREARAAPRRVVRERAPIGQMILRSS